MDINHSQLSDAKSFNGVSNTKIVHGKRVFNCTLCGKCCYFREDKHISPSDEAKYYEYMFAKFGIIYLAPLSEITISIWPEEAEALRDAARQRGLDLKVKPKRAIYDELHNELIILDYFLDHDLCPFFDKQNRSCGVYDVRPLICRAFPLLGNGKSGNCEYKPESNDDYSDEKAEASKLDMMVAEQKRIIAMLVDTSKIKIPQSMSSEEMERIISSASIKEMRIMDSILGRGKKT